LVPLIIVVIVVLHLIFLHSTGSSTPIGANLNVDKIPFHPYFTIKDSFIFFVFLLSLILICLVIPYDLGDPENFNEANPLVTPVHIQPE
jgi:ubiquinol-cytochrome c reductase cytochrome b subunit